MKYHPDGWKLVKMTNLNSETHYRVFAVWRGGYLSGDSWKLNSGVTEATFNDLAYEFTGSSGSIYHCNIDSYGLSYYGESVLDNLIEKYKDSVTIEPLKKEEMIQIVKSKFNAGPQEN